MISNDYQDPTLDAAKKKPIPVVGGQQQQLAPLGNDPTQNGSVIPQVGDAQMATDAQPTDPAIGSDGGSPLIPKTPITDDGGLAQGNGQVATSTLGGAQQSDAYGAYVPKVGMGADQGGTTAATKNAGYDPTTGDPTTGGQPTDLMTPQTTATQHTPDTSVPPVVPPTPAISTSAIPPVTPTTSVPAVPTLPAVGASAQPANPNDPRYVTVDPTASTRLTGAQGATDAASSAVQGFDAAKTLAGNVDQYGTKLATPDVGFTGVNTTVNRTAVDPNIVAPSVATDVSAGPAVDPVTGQRLSTFQQQQDAAAAAIAGGANRQTLAQQQLDAFDQQSAPGIRNAMRAVGQRASVLGRVGNGQTAIEALTPYTDYLTNRSALETKLAADTAAGDIQDRQNNLSAASGLVGQTAGLDAATRGEQRTERTNVQDTTAQNLARQVAERNVQLGVASGNRTAAQQEADAQAAAGTGNVNRAMAQNTEATSNAQENAARQLAIKQAAISAGLNATDLTSANNTAKLSAASGIEGQVGAEDAAARGELRTERSNQQQLSDKATADAIAQHQLESGDANTGFDQALQAYYAANGGNPAGAYQTAAGQQGGQSDAAYQALMKMIQDRAASQPPVAAGR